MPIEPKPDELSEAELRPRLEQEARLLVADDNAFQATSELSPAELRTWSDNLGKPEKLRRYGRPDRMSKMRANSRG